MVEDKSIFEEVEESNELPSEETVSEEIDDDEIEESWTPIVDKESPKEKKERKGVKAEAGERILTIKEYFFTKPKTKTPEGIALPPNKTIDGLKSFYPGKLGIRFVEDYLIEYYPNFHYFVGEKGEISRYAKINREGNNQVTALFKLVVAKMGKKEEDVSDLEAFEFLKGKKVKIATVKGKYMNRDWFRNNIVEIL